MRVCAGTYVHTCASYQHSCVGLGLVCELTLFKLLFLRTWCHMPGDRGRVLQKSRLGHGLRMGKVLWVPGTVSSPVTAGKRARKSIPVTQLQAPRLFICLAVTVLCSFRSVCECMCGCACVPRRNGLRYLRPPGQGMYVPVSGVCASSGTTVVCIFGTR